MPARHPVQQTQQHRPSIVESFRRNGYRSRESSPDSAVSAEKQRGKIDRQAPPTECEGAVARVLACEFADCKVEDRDEIGDKEDDGRYGNDGVEGCGRPEIDEGEDHADCSD